MHESFRRVGRENYVATVKEHGTQKDHRNPMFHSKPSNHSTIQRLNVCLPRPSCFWPFHLPLTSRFSSCLPRDVRSTSLRPRRCHSADESHGGGRHVGGRSAQHLQTMAPAVPWRMCRAWLFLGDITYPNLYTVQVPFITMPDVFHCFSVASPLENGTTPPMREPSTPIHLLQ